MNPIEKYFDAEKYESVLFILIGIIAIAFAGYFLLRIKQPFYTGIAYPLVLVALIQIIVGSTVYLRSPKDIVRVNQIIERENQKIKTEEIPRMEVVMKNFDLYRWIEIILILIGVLMFLLSQTSSMFKGIGLGLIIQASFMLMLDYFAESRGKIYLEFLNQIN